MRKAKIFFLFLDLIKREHNYLCLLISGETKCAIDKPKMTSLLQWLAVIKHPTCNRNTGFSNSYSPKPVQCTPRKGTWWKCHGIKAMMWISSPGNVMEQRKPDPGPFLFMSHHMVLQTYPIWSRGFHAHVLRDSCSFHGHGCWTSWILERFTLAAFLFLFFLIERCIF